MSPFLISVPFSDFLSGGFTEAEAGVVVGWPDTTATVVATAALGGDATTTFGVNTPDSFGDVVGDRTGFSPGDTIALS
jgi:hypothetical protein